ncbi:Nif11-like leader peptide family natural product precursor [Actinoallomurus sp. NPDC052274]|uniref:Nif11-like leader peptide family natural product precursor n=1 Tax=Actinoallomurus sp. NPDC052274 TaxID=3155420 RepID=UPI0034397D61
MTVESCTRFLRLAEEDPQVRQQMKALTGVEEVIRLARTGGYDFTVRDLITASAEAGARDVPEPLDAPPAGDRPKPPAGAVYHYEYDMNDLPGFDAIIDELPRLKVQPSTVDLARFHDAFREEDLHSTALAPSGPEYQAWRDRVAAAPAGDVRRDFHLINLDEHVAHQGYDAYLAAKTRAIAALEDVFHAEVRFSGSMWYPPSAYRLWHTNEDQPGWRMYIVDFDGDFADPERTSFFRYQNPATGELVTLREHPRMVRFFKIEQEQDRLLWHCIVNPTERHRWSFGFVVPEHWAECLPEPS